MISRLTQAAQYLFASIKRLASIKIGIHSAECSAIDVCLREGEVPSEPDTS